MCTRTPDASSTCYMERCRGRVGTWTFTACDDDYNLRCNDDYQLPTESPCDREFAPIPNPTFVPQNLSSVQRLQTTAVTVMFQRRLISAICRQFLICLSYIRNKI